MRKKIIIILILTMASLEAIALPSICDPYITYTPKRVQEFCSESIQGKTLFTGSSSIRGWPEIERNFPTLNSSNYINKGINGANLCHLLHNFKDIFTNEKKEKPSRIVLYIGDNDLYNKFSPDTVARLYKMLLEKLENHKINVPTYIFSIKSSLVLQKKGLHGKVNTTNQKLKTIFSEYKNVHYIDIYNALLTDDKKEFKLYYYKKDGLHLRPRAYKEIWNKKLQELWLKHDLENSLASKNANCEQY